MGNGPVRTPHNRLLTPTPAAGRAESAGWASRGPQSGPARYWTTDSGRSGLARRDTEPLRGGAVWPGEIQSHWGRGGIARGAGEVRFELSRVRRRCVGPSAGRLGLLGVLADGRLPQTVHLLCSAADGLARRRLQLLETGRLVVVLPAGRRGGSEHRPSAARGTGRGWRSGHRSIQWERYGSGGARRVRSTGEM